MATTGKIIPCSHGQAADAVENGFDGIVIIVQDALVGSNQSVIDLDRLNDITDLDKTLDVYFDISHSLTRNYQGKIVEGGQKLKGEDALRIINACKEQGDVLVAGATDTDPRVLEIIAGIARTKLKEPTVDPYNQEHIPSRYAHDEICHMSNWKTRRDAKKNADADFKRAIENQMTIDWQVPNLPQKQNQTKENSISF